MYESLSVTVKINYSFFTFIFAVLLVITPEVCNLCIVVGLLVILPM